MVEGGIIMINVPGLQTRLNNSNNKDSDNKKWICAQIQFLLCESCFWCASCLSSKNVSVVKCPICHDNGKIKWMPISNKMNV